MELTALSLHSVRFRGPALTRMARGALSAAGVSVIERRRSADLGGQVQEYFVSVEARDSEDSARRVRAVLSAHGSYTGFAANP